MKPRTALFAGVLALGCWTQAPSVMYPGPRRSAPEVAVLENAETSLDLLDGVELHHVRSQDGARYEVLPGRHALGVSLFIVTVDPGGPGAVERSANVALLCLDAQAGHTYVIGHEGRRAAAWRPLITDRDSRAVVPFAPCPLQ
jgi:hypothetical protein